MLSGTGPIPRAPGALRSSTQEWPTDSAASAKRSCSSCQAARGYRLIGDRPRVAVPRRASPKSRSLSTAQNHGNQVSQP